MSELKFIEDKYSWNNLTLWQFLEDGNIPSGWEDFFLNKEIQTILFNISKNLELQKCIIYPPIHQVFRAFYMTPLDKIKATIIALDPYHNGTTEYNGSAVGLCFSVRPGNLINPSLKNIYKELNKEGFDPKQNGELLHWAKQGVLLLNMALTVEQGCADSHTSLWYPFSEKVVKYIDEHCGSEVQWLLFGSQAHSVGDANVSNGIVHKTTHPSPFAATRASKTAVAFIGSGVFQNVIDIKW